MHSWIKYGFIDSHVSLNFINTIDDEGKTRTLNAIPDWTTILQWAVTAKVLSNKEAESLAHYSDEASIRDEQDKLYEFREVAWCVLSSVVANQTVDTDNINKLSATIKWALAETTFEQNGRIFHWSVCERDFGLQLIRARLALAVFDLMTHQDMACLKECGRCTALFLDHGRGVGRRWCRMKTCGNRAKTERFRNKSNSN